MNRRLGSESRSLSLSLCIACYTFYLLSLFLNLDEIPIGFPLSWDWISLGLKPFVILYDSISIHCGFEPYRNPFLSQDAFGSPFLFGCLTPLAVTGMLVVVTLDTLLLHVPTSDSCKLRWEGTRLLGRFDWFSILLAKIGVTCASRPTFSSWHFFHIKHSYFVY